MSSSNDDLPCADPSPPATLDGDEAVVVVSGFDGIKNASSKVGGGKEALLRWYAAPDSWSVGANATEEGQGGSWSVLTSADNQEETETQSPTPLVLLLNPPTKKDFWRKTYYDPILVKDDGPFLFAELDAAQMYTVEASFVLTAMNQFDQAGIMIRIDHEHWIKTGIEVVDHVPRLSCVVTNSYSDWSTQPWSDDPHQAASKESVAAAPVIVTARVRVHCRHSSYVVEAWVNNRWEFIRICHLSRELRSMDDPLRNHPNVMSAWEGPAAPDGKLWAGIFGACPIQAGARIEFRHFSITEGSHFDHNAD